MSLADELARLENLRVSGAITREEFEQSKSRLLDACVRRIEAVHDAKAPASLRREPPPVKVVQGTVQHIRFLLPEDKQQSCASPTKDSRSGVKPPFEPAKIRRPDGNAFHGEIFQEQKAPAPSRRESPPAEAARGGVQNVRFQEREETRQHAAAAYVGQRLSVSRGEVFQEQKPPAPTHREMPPGNAARGGVKNVRFVVRQDSPQHAAAKAVAQAEVGASALQASRASEEETPAEAQKPPSDDCRLFEAFYDRKTPLFARWGLPPVKVVRGIVRNVVFSRRKGDEEYAASVEVDGRRVEIGAASSIGIDAGDQVALGGYERDGKLLALAYHNESKGAHSDLKRLRRGYRFLLTIGWVSLLAGLAAIAVTGVLLVVHRRAGELGSGLWGYVPYALSGLGAAAVSYFGLGLSFLGVRAKEFHDAMATSAPRAANPS